MDYRGSSPRGNHGVETIKTLRQERLPFAELTFAARANLELETKQKELAQLEDSLTTQQSSVLKSQSKLMNLSSQIDSITERLLTLQQSACEINVQKVSAEQGVLTNLKDLVSCFQALKRSHDTQAGDRLTRFTPPALDTLETPHAINDLADFIDQCRETIASLARACDNNTRKALDNAIKKTGKLELALDRYELSLEYQNEHLKVVSKTAKELALARGARAAQTVDVEIRLEQVQKMQIDVSYQTADFDEQMRVFSSSVEQIEEHVFGKALSIGENGKDPKEVFTRYRNALALIDLLLGRNPDHKQKIRRLPDL